MPRTPAQDRELAAFLSEFVMPERVALIDRVLPSRTRYVTVMLEDIYQSQNASALMRTCDCLGVQDMYIVENR
ncbi:MAG: TrmH family RNA methyltransferase, partial [Bacteroidales bacterium]|nr:TrmH family RNA methyltransferase [Bacteroidales bacterium]